MLHPPTSKLTEVADDGKPRCDTAAAQAREAETLYQTLEGWQNTAGDLNERVQAGNCVYQHAAQVSVVLVRCLFACPCRWSLLACFGRWSSDQGCSALALLARSLGSCLGLRLGGWSDDWVTDGLDDRARRDRYSSSGTCSRRTRRTRSCKSMRTWSFPYAWTADRAGWASSEFSRLHLPIFHRPPSVFRSSDGLVCLSSASVSAPSGV